MPSIPIPRLVLLITGFFFILISYLKVFQSSDGLEEYTFVHHDVPLRYVGPKEFSGKIPAMIIAHGFSGSQQLMLGYAYTYAHAGYATILVDFSGHGSNSKPIDFQSRKDALQDDLAAAYDALGQKTFVDMNRVGLLGHSMGSGAVLHQSINNPEDYIATIAISPAFQGLEVNDSIPSNLLIQAGALETPFIRNGEKLFEMAGGKNDTFSGRKARKMSIIPGVEHISILFNNQSHSEALEWTNKSLKHQTEEVYSDHRMLWFGLHVLGWLMIILGFKPLVEKWMHGETLVEVPNIKRSRLFITMFGAPVLATLIMVMIAKIYPTIGGIGGLLVGGAFALWFFFCGILWGLFSKSFYKPSKQELLTGLVFFAILSFSFGYLAQIVWLPYFLIGTRLLKWGMISIACVPFFFVCGYLLHNKIWYQRLLGWLGISASLLIGTLLLINFVAGTGFLILVAPIMPLILGIIVVGGSTFKKPWAFAIGGGLFFAWQLAMIFPLS